MSFPGGWLDRLPSPPISGPSIHTTSDQSRSCQTIEITGDSPAATSECLTHAYGGGGCFGGGRSLVRTKKRQSGAIRVARQKRCRATACQYPLTACLRSQFRRGQGGEASSGVAQMTSHARVTDMGVNLRLADVNAGIQSARIGVFPALPSTCNSGLYPPFHLVCEAWRNKWHGPTRLLDGSWGPGELRCGPLPGGGPLARQREGTLHERNRARKTASPPLL